MNQYATAPATANGIDVDNRAPSEPRSSGLGPNAEDLRAPAARLSGL